MASISERAPRAAWSRGQRFTLSPKGDEAELAYRDAVVASRTSQGRASFDSARASWAGTHQLQPDDGLYLAELRAGPKNTQELVEALETCGKTKQDAIAALKRLVDSGLLSPLTAGA